MERISESWFGKLGRNVDSWEKEHHRPVWISTGIVCILVIIAVESIAERNRVVSGVAQGEIPRVVAETPAFSILETSRRDYQVTLKVPPSPERWRDILASLDGDRKGSACSWNIASLNREFDLFHASCGRP